MTLFTALMPPPPSSPAELPEIVLLIIVFPLFPKHASPPPSHDAVLPLTVLWSSTMTQTARVCRSNHIPGPTLPPERSAKQRGPER
jgi:hypothetical protein